MANAIVRISVLLLLSSLLPADAEPTPPHPVGGSIVASASNPYRYHEQEAVLPQLFVDTVYSWLRRYKPSLISRTDSNVHLQATYDVLFNIELQLGIEKYEVYVRPAQPVRREQRARDAAAHLADGINLRLNQAVQRWAAENRVELANNALIRRAEALMATLDAEREIVLQTKGDDPVRAYPAIASYLYKQCQKVANNFLDADLKKFEDAFEAGLGMIKTCAAREETVLGNEVRRALGQLSGPVADQMKDLHAYTIASLRALTNFHQSAVEARRARAERSAGIDERVTRVELEF